MIHVSGTIASGNPFAMWQSQNISFMTTLYKSKSKSGWTQDCTFVTVTSPAPIAEESM